MISQVNVYVMDTVRRYYVMFICRGQYSTEVIWFFEEASSRICYVILFECTGL